MNIALPGDFIGFPACFFEDAPYSFDALTDTVLAPIPFTALIGLFEKQPRLAAAIFWSFSLEAAIYIEHLTDVGRRSALERVAHSLLELLTRFQVIGLADETSFPMPLTQELIGDALGLSVPHVNRTLRAVREDGLASIEAHRVMIKDVEALSALADFEKPYLAARMPDPFAGGRRGSSKPMEPGGVSPCDRSRDRRVEAGRPQRGNPDRNKAGHDQDDETDRERQQIGVYPAGRALEAPDQPRP